MGFYRRPNLQLQPVNTANASQSIWGTLGRNAFRYQAVALRQIAGEIAGDDKVHSAETWQARRTREDGNLLPFEVEQRLADDFAYVAAAEENLLVVSAVALEQYIEPCKIVMRLAANAYVPKIVPEAFDSLFGNLRCCALNRSKLDLFPFLLPQTGCLPN